MFFKSIGTSLMLLLAGCHAVNEKQDLVWAKSSCDALPSIDFNVTSIYQGMEERANDTLWNKYWKAEYEQQMTVLKQSTHDNHALFPYQAVDSALFYFYEPASKTDENLALDTRQVKDVSHLCLRKTELLLNVINNPLNFGTAECGTNIPFSKVVLFNQGQEIGNVVFSCSYSMVGTYPENPMITGGLTPQGDSLLTAIKLWE